MVTEVFREYVGYNYPGTVRDFLDRQLRDGNALEVQVAERSLAAIEEYCARRRILPQPKELEPPATRVREFRKVQEKVFARGMEAARGHSVILSLATRVPLKSGTSWFSDQDGRLTEPSELQEISTEFELPRGVSIDPVGLGLQRRMWRAETRGQQT
jgi:hypothetical protein